MTENSSPQTPLRFVSWAAVSSLPQAKKISLEDQLKTNGEHIQRHGGQVVTELVVPGESRNIVLFEEACRRIAAYDQLHRLIASRAFDVLIYLDRSRLGRKASLSMAVVELCHEAGILTYETENPPSLLDVHGAHNQDEMLLGAIKSVGAQQEIHKLVQRHRMGMIARIKKGLFPKKIPWGWKAVYAEDGKRSIVIDEDAAVIIRLLATLYLQQGLSMSAAATELNRRGYRTRGGLAWQLGNVQGVFAILWRYAGYSEINFGQEYVKAKGQWPAILTEDTVRAIQAERKNRLKRARAVHAPYLLSRLVVCTEHHGYLAVNIQKQGKDGVYSYLRCRHCRPYHYIPFSQVTDVLHASIAYLQDAANRTALLGDLEQSDSRSADQMEGVRKQIRQTDTALQRADDAYVSGVMDTERYQRQVDKLTEVKRQQLQELAALEAAAVGQRFDASRQARLEEIAMLGTAMLTATDVASANAWLRRHFVVYITGATVSRVEYL